MKVVPNEGLLELHAWINCELPTLSTAQQPYCDTGSIDRVSFGCTKGLYVAFRSTFLNRLDSLT